MKSLTSFITQRLFIFFIAILVTSCSSVKTLVGDVKPVETQSDETTIPDLTKTHPKWKKISMQSGSPDAAWQSEATAAVISIDSACRENLDAATDLKEITENLLSQWHDLHIRHEKSLTVSGFSALETTAEGNYLKRPRKFQTVIVKTPSCIYDLIFLSPVATFDQELSVFHQFRDSLILK